MVKSSKIEQIYQQYGKQINTILSMTKGNISKAAKIIAWFYGGSWETWRKFLKSRMPTEPLGKDVQELFKKVLENKD
jgi:hypothetical protein